MLTKLFLIMKQKFYLWLLRIATKNLSIEIQHNTIKSSEGGTNKDDPNHIDFVLSGVDSFRISKFHVITSNDLYQLDHKPGVYKYINPGWKSARRFVKSLNRINYDIENVVNPRKSKLTKINYLCHEKQDCT